MLKRGKMKLIKSVFFAMFIFGLIMSLNGVFAVCTPVIGVGCVEEVGVWHSADNIKITIGEKSTSLQAYIDSEFGKKDIGTWQEEAHNDKAWHNAEDIQIKAQGQRVSLQSYVTKNFNAEFAGEWKDDEHVEWHYGEQIKINGKSISLQQAINEGLFSKNKTPENPEYSDNSFENNQRYIDYYDSEPVGDMVSNADLESNDRKYQYALCPLNSVAIGISYNDVSHAVVKIGTDRVDGVSVICAPYSISMKDKKITINYDRKKAVANEDVTTRGKIWLLDENIAGVWEGYNNLPEKSCEIFNSQTAEMERKTGDPWCASIRPVSLSYPPLVNRDLLNVVVTGALTVPRDMQLSDTKNPNKPREVLCEKGYVLSGISYIQLSQEDKLQMISKDDTDGFKAICAPINDKGKVNEDINKMKTIMPEGDEMNAGEEISYSCTSDKIMVGLAWKDRRVPITQNLIKTYMDADQLDGATPVCVKYFPFSE